MSYSIKGDIHTHTLFSRHAYSTISENVAAARRRGLEVLGSADHFSSMISPTVHIRDYQFFINQSVWPRMWDGVMVLRGAEADILTLDGGLFGQDIVCPENIVGRALKGKQTLFEYTTKSLDYLVASIHYDEFARDATLAQATQMYLNVLENPKVFVLGHTGRSGVPYDTDEVILAAKEKHKLIEINEHSFDGGPHGSCVSVCRKIAERCAELGCGITVSTDAHISLDIGLFPRATSLLEEIHFPEELIMNRDRKTLVSEMAAAGICDLTSCLSA